MVAAVIAAARDDRLSERPPISPQLSTLVRGAAQIAEQAAEAPSSPGSPRQRKN